MFKSGDRVRVVKIEHGAAEHTLGEVGVVDYRNNEDGDYKVRFDDQDYWYYQDSELEMADPTVSQSQQTGQLTSHDTPALRDQFAMAAMIAMIANDEFDISSFAKASKRETVAECAYLMAATMLAAREAK